MGGALFSLNYEHPKRTPSNFAFQAWKGFIGTLNKKNFWNPASPFWEKPQFVLWLTQTLDLADPHILRNSFWIKKNWASHNESKFHIYLKCSIWIYIKNLISPWTSNLTWFGIFWENLALSECSCTCNICLQNVSSVFFQKKFDHHKFEISSVKVLPVQKMPNSYLISKEKLRFPITNSDSTLQICMKFALIVTCLVFLDWEWITNNVPLNKLWIFFVHGTFNFHNVSKEVFWPNFFFWISWMG